MKRRRHNCPLETLEGLTIAFVTGLRQYSGKVAIHTVDDREFVFEHEQDCCESVTLDDFDGDPEDLQGAVIYMAEKVSSNPRKREPSFEELFFTEYIPEVSDGDWEWTFYKIETNKGGLWMRWLGDSNGYYATDVSFGEMISD
jgi:hypothetical protein